MYWLNMANHTHQTCIYDRISSAVFGCMEQLECRQCKTVGGGGKLCARKCGAAYNVSSELIAE